MIYRGFIVVRGRKFIVDFIVSENIEYAKELKKTGISNYNIGLKVRGKSIPN
jgi:hypothetical protein